MSFLDSLADVVMSVVDTVVDTADSAVDFVVENPGKAIAIGVGTLATGGMALAAAPAVGAVVSAAGFGVAGGTLSGRRSEFRRPRGAGGR